MILELDAVGGLRRLRQNRQMTLRSQGSSWKLNLDYQNIDVVVIFKCVGFLPPLPNFGDF